MSWMLYCEKTGVRVERLAGTKWEQHSFCCPLHRNELASLIEKQPQCALRQCVPNIAIDEADSSSRVTYRALRGIRDRIYKLDGFKSRPILFAYTSATMAVPPADYFLKGNYSCSAVVSDVPYQKNHLDIYGRRVYWD